MSLFPLMPFFLLLICRSKLIGCYGKFPILILWGAGLVDRNIRHWCWNQLVRVVFIDPLREKQHGVFQGSDRRSFLKGQFPGRSEWLVLRWIFRKC